MRLREQLAGLVPRGVEHLRPLALALLAVALDLGLAVLQLDLATAHLFLRLAELRRGGVLCIALDRVGELRGSADEMQRVHPDGVPAGLDNRGTARSLEHPELRLQLRRVASKGVEGLANALRIEAVPGRGKVLESRQTRQRRGSYPVRPFGCHLVRASWSTRRSAVRS